MIQTNQTTPFFLTKLAIPHLKTSKGGILRRYELSYLYAPSLIINICNFYAFILFLIRYLIILQMLYTKYQTEKVSFQSSPAYGIFINAFIR